MKARKKQKLERTGWKIGSAKELLSLSEKEAAFVDFKLRLSANPKERGNLENSGLVKELLNKRRRRGRM